MTGSSIHGASNPARIRNRDVSAPGGDEETFRWIQPGYTDNKHPGRLGYFQAKRLLDPVEVLSADVEHPDDPSWLPSSVQSSGCSAAGLSDLLLD